MPANRMEIGPAEDAGGGMKEIIEDILEEEKKARERLDRARDESKKIRLEAEEKNKTMIAEARRKAQEEAKAYVEKAEAEARQARDTQLDLVKKAAETMWDDKKEKIDEAVEALTAIVLKGETE